MKKFKESHHIYEYLNILEDIFVELVDDSIESYIYYNNQISYSKEDNISEIECTSAEKTSIFRYRTNTSKYIPHFTVELVISGAKKIEIIQKSISSIKRIELEGLKLLTGDLTGDLRSGIYGHGEGLRLRTYNNRYDWFYINIKDRILSKETIDKIESCSDEEKIYIEIRFIF